MRLEKVSDQFLEVDRRESSEIIGRSHVSSPAACFEIMVSRDSMRRIGAFHCRGGWLLAARHHATV